MTDWLILFGANVEVNVYLKKAYTWNWSTIFSFLYNFEPMVLMFRKYILKLALKYSCSCDSSLVEEKQKSPYFPLLVIFPNSHNFTFTKKHRTFLGKAIVKSSISGCNNHKKLHFYHCCALWCSWCPEDWLKTESAEPAGTTLTA